MLRNLARRRCATE